MADLPWEDWQEVSAAEHCEHGPHLPPLPHFFRIWPHHAVDRSLSEVCSLDSNPAAGPLTVFCQQNQLPCLCRSHGTEGVQPDGPHLLKFPSQCDHPPAKTAHMLTTDLVQLKA